MPTYVCSAATGRLTPTQKAEIVRSITAIHHEENRNDGVTQVFLPVTQRLVGYRVSVRFAPCGQHLAHKMRRRDGGFGQG